jgi:WhiB family redox-sensing transcriptional regulator
MTLNDPRHTAAGFDYKPETWMDDAACIGHDPEWWFPDDRGRGGAERSATTQAAKAICATCPVSVKCLDYVMRVEPGWTKHGIWAGTTADARRELGREAS